DGGVGGPAVWPAFTRVVVRAGGVVGCAGVARVETNRSVLVRPRGRDGVEVAVRVVANERVDERSAGSGLQLRRLEPGHVLVRRALEVRQVRVADRARHGSFAVDAGTVVED